MCVALALCLYSVAHGAPVSTVAGILGLLSVGLAATLALACGSLCLGHVGLPCGGCPCVLL